MLYKWFELFVRLDRRYRSRYLVQLVEVLTAISVLLLASMLERKTNATVTRIHLDSIVNNRIGPLSTESLTLAEGHLV